MKKAASLPGKQSQPGKKKYETPQMVCYGTVAKLTAGSTGGGSDGPTHPHTKMCWIAEVIYGVDAPPTHLIRAWLTDCYERREPWSLMVVPIYRRFGERVAGFLRTYPAFNCVFRPLFDLGVTRALRERARQTFTLARIGAPS